MLLLPGVENAPGAAQGVFHVVGHHDDGYALGFVEIGQSAVEILCGGRVNGILDGRSATKEEVGLRMTNLVKEAGV